MLGGAVSCMRILKRIFQQTYAFAHRFDFFMELLGIGEDKSIHRSVTELAGLCTNAKWAYLLPFPPVNAPSGHISAHPRLQQDWHGNTRSHCNKIRIYSRIYTAPTHFKLEPTADNEFWD